jgi:hypothetical protein
MNQIYNCPYFVNVEVATKLLTCVGRIERTNDLAKVAQQDSRTTNSATRPATRPSTRPATRASLVKDLHADIMGAFGRADQRQYDQANRRQRF